MYQQDQFARSCTKAHLGRGLCLERNHAQNLNKDQVFRPWALNIRMKSSHGGARPGAGRPKGSGNKVRLEDLMLDVELAANMPYTKRVAINYVSAINREDWARVENYDRAFLNKLVADKSEVEVTDTADTVANRAQAFQDALAKLAQIADTTK